MLSRKLSSDRTRGFTLIEVIVAIMIVAAMGTMYVAVFPLALRSSTMGAYYTQAAGIATHKLEQIHAAGYAQLTSPANLVALGIADLGSASNPTVPYTVTFTTTDNLVSGVSGPSLLPTGSTGTISVSDLHSANASIPAGLVMNVIVTLRWQGASVSSGQYSVSTLVAETEHT